MVGLTENSDSRRYFLPMTHPVVITSRGMQFSAEAEAYLHSPPTLNVAFIGHDLLIMAGTRHKLRNGVCRLRARAMLLRPGAYSLQKTVQPGVFVLPGCALHFYKDPHSW